MGHDCVVCTDGNLSLPLFGHKHAGFQRGDQHHGILLPEHVQCHPVRLDARGLSSTYSRDGLRCSQLLGPTIQYRVAQSRYCPLGKEHQRSSLSGRIWGFCLHYMHCSNATEIHGRQELLSFELCHLPKALARTHSVMMDHSYFHCIAGLF